MKLLNVLPFLALLGICSCHTLVATRLGPAAPVRNFRLPVVSDTGTERQSVELADHDDNQNMRDEGLWKSAGSTVGRSRRDYQAGIQKRHSYFESRLDSENPYAHGADSTQILESLENTMLAQNDSSLDDVLKNLPNPIKHGTVQPLPPGMARSDPDQLSDDFYMLSAPSGSLIIPKTQHRDQYEALICFGLAISAESSSEVHFKYRLLDISHSEGQTWKSGGFLNFSAVNPSCLGSRSLAYANFLPSLATSPSQLSVFIFGFGSASECGQLLRWSRSQGLQYVSTTGSEHVPHLYHGLTTQQTGLSKGGAYRLITFGGQICLNGSEDPDNCQLGTNSLWQMTFASDDTLTGHWEKIAVDSAGEVPEERFSADLYAVSSSRLIMYGGFSRGEDSVPLCDVWEFDMALRQWSMLGNLSSDCETRSRCSSQVKQLSAFLSESNLLVVVVAQCAGADYTVHVLELTTHQPRWYVLSKSNTTGDAGFVFFGAVRMGLKKLALMSSSSTSYLVEENGASTHRLAFERSFFNSGDLDGSAAMLLMNDQVGDRFVGNWGCITSSPILLPMPLEEQVFLEDFHERVYTHAILLGGLCSDGSSNVIAARATTMPIWTFAMIANTDEPVPKAFYTKNVVRPGPPFGQRVGHSAVYLSNHTVEIIALYGGGHANSVFNQDFVAVPADVWCFDVQRYHWMQAITTHKGMERLFHVAFRVSNTSFAVYGGSDQPGGRLHAINDISLFEFSDLAQCKGNWLDLSPSTVPHPLPALYGHALVNFRGHNLVYGGSTNDATSCFSELLFALSVEDNDTVVWRNLSFESAPPLGRQFHSVSVYNPDSLLVIGNRSKPLDQSMLDYTTTAMLFTFKNSGDIFAENAVTVQEFFNDLVTYFMHKIGGYLIGGQTRFANTVRGDTGEMTFVYGSQYNTLTFGLCPVGRQSVGTTCQDCPLGNYSSSLTLPCQPCLEGTKTKHAGSFDVHACYAPDPCIPDPCNGHGTCTKDNRTLHAVCTCDPGYMSQTMCFLPIYFMIAGTVFLLAVIIILVVVRKYRLSRAESHERHRQLRASKKKITELTQVWEIQWEQLTMREKIAVGGFGEVWRAELSDMLVAVKKLRHHSLGDPSSIRDFQRESELMRTVRHPNVVLFLGAGTMPDGAMFLVLEYLKRGSLRGQLKDISVPLDYGDRLRFALDAAKGMAFLHGLSPPRIHRDLKSSNLLVSDKWVVKVADFGTARLVEKLETPQPVSQELTAPTATEGNQSVQETTPLISGSGSGPMSTPVGTYLWQSPEMMARRAYGASTDVYSYGIVLWEIFFRETPFNNREDFRFYSVLAEAVIGGYRPQLPNEESEDAVPADYRELMEACWHMDPTQRPSFRDIAPKLQVMLDAVYTAGAN